MRVLALLLLTACSHPAPSRWIAFVSDRAGDYDLYVVHQDGSDLHAVAHSPASDLYPSWSPDGKRIAFASNRDGAFGLYAVEIATDVVTPVATGLGDAATSPAWSPDGETLIFTGLGGLYRVAATGGVASSLTSGGFRDSAAAWSRDGDHVYFASDRAGVFDVWSVGPGGGAPTQVTKGTGIVGGPAVSPDGQELVFAVGMTTTSLASWNIASGQMKVLSALGDYEPAFSVAGDRLAVTSTRYAADNPEIVILGATDGAEVLRLTDAAGVDGQAVFAPR